MATEWVPIRPGADALPAHGDGAGAHQRGPRRPRHVRRPRHRPRRGRRGRGAVHARGRRPRHRHRRRRHPPPRPRAGGRAHRRASTAASAPPPPSSARSRRWLVDVLNVLTGNLDRPGGAMFTTAAAGASNTRGKPRFGREVQPAPPPQPGARAARDLRRAAGGRAWPRRWTRPARARSAPWSPSPATRCCPRRTPRASTPPSPASSAWCPSTSTSTRPPGTPT